ncbi:MAG: KamA family radical SAM protein [Hyphomonadaceae bacterium]|jgi:lysine 2,3-aminomutase|nr:KamA family radical SAM protein [Hyphomonadaceae bacterium]
MSLNDVLGFENSSGLYASTPKEDFLNHAWQDKNSIIRIEQLEAVVRDKIAPAALSEIRDGLKKVGMSIRLNPYIMELIDWRNVETDPIRRQFLPMISELEADHPCMSVDSLEERNTSPAPNLVHRYPDKVLFLVTSVCPVYCQYCTRSYAVGQDTPSLQKDNVTSANGWAAALDYIRSTPTIEDVVVSGGDIARLKPQNIKVLGNALLDIEHVRRIRFATKSVSVQPMKFLSDDAWFSAIAEVAKRGRDMFKSVFVHTHFNHPREVTPLVEKAMRRLFAESIYVRNQAVLLRGVNDDSKTLIELTKKLGRVNIQPYYVYSCDMVMGTEHFRVSIEEMQHLEREVRGATAGFNTPLFIVDAPGGGGKRDVHSYEYRNDKYGVTGYRSPSVDRNRMYFHFDPLRTLDAEARAEWRAPGGREAILERLRLAKPIPVAAE